MWNWNMKSFFNETLNFFFFSKDIHACFYKQHVFAAQPQCCSTVSWIELQMFLSCCLIYVKINIPRHILYLVYMCPCLCLGLFMSYLFDIFFIFSLIFIVTNNTSLFKEMYLFFGTLFRMSPIIFGC